MRRPAPSHIIRPGLRAIFFNSYWCCGRWLKGSFFKMYENLFDASSDEHDVPIGVDHPDELEAVPDEGPANADNGRGGRRGAYNQRRIGRIKAGMAKRQLMDAKNSVIQLSGMLKPALSEKVSSVFAAKMLDEAVERKISVGGKCATINLRGGKSYTRCATTKSLVDRALVSHVEMQAEGLAAFVSPEQPQRCEHVFSMNQLDDASMWISDPKATKKNCGKRQ